MTTYFAHISDTHIGPTKEYARHGHQSYACAVRMVEILNRLPTRPDFVVHTGDIVTDPHPDSWKLAVEVFAALELPIYFVMGNHDNSAEFRTHFQLPDHEDFRSQTGKNDYAFAVNRERFLVLDARLGREFDPHGGLSDEQYALLRSECTPEGVPLTVFIHFPALPMGAPWMDENMLLFEGERFHQTLLPARERLRGVFHGHVHQPMQTVRDGILYVCAPSTFSQFNGWPADVDVRMDGDALPGYNFVHLNEECVIVHTHTFPRPD